MPPNTVSAGLDFSTLLLGLTAALSAVTAYFLTRFVRQLDERTAQQDERDGKITEALAGILTRLAVHDIKHEQVEKRLDSLESGEK